MEKEIVKRWFTSKENYPFKVIHHGIINPYDGPDIRNIEILFNGITYYGVAEVEKTQKEWYYHGHFQHALYQDVLLHIIDENTVPPPA